MLCISEDFEGKNVVQRQRLVYKAIWDELQGTLCCTIISSTYS
ncbi:BolA/IbaG family iron-sulfur metabolism protein [archaeon]|nr:MAG: BolA/IbaG family iron-sulfur metabolism protein [archaeon]